MLKRVGFDLSMLLDFPCAHMTLLLSQFNENVYDLLIFFHIIDIRAWIKIYTPRFVANVNIQAKP